MKVRGHVATSAEKLENRANFARSKIAAKVWAASAAAAGCAGGAGRRAGAAPLFLRNRLRMRACVSVS